MRWIVITCVSVLAACADTVTAARPCIVSSQMFSLDDPEVILRMQVASGAEKCVIFVAKSIGGTSGTIRRNPQHGTAEMISERSGTTVRGVGVAVGFGGPGSNNAEQYARGAVYKPAMGYTGDDEFRFDMSPIRRSMFTVHVQVVAAKAN